MTHYQKYLFDNKTYAQREASVISWHGKIRWIKTLEQMEEIWNYLGKKIGWSLPSGNFIYFSVGIGGSPDTFFVGLHNMNRATSTLEADLKWYRQHEFDPTVFSSIADVNVTSGEYCMTLRLDVATNRLVLEDSSCTATLGAIVETDCYDRGELVIRSSFSFLS